jgi:hypothetical protein
MQDSSPRRRSDQPFTEWSAIGAFGSKTGTTKISPMAAATSISRHSASETVEKLEALGRRTVLRGANFVRQVNLPQYPFLIVQMIPMRHPSAALRRPKQHPFGEAITVNTSARLSPDTRGELRTEVQLAEIRTRISPSALDHKSKTDAGEEITDDDKQAYQTTRNALLVDDFHTPRPTSILVCPSCSTLMRSKRIATTEFDV